MSVDWEPVIGLEIHVQLKTRTKMFCGCELSFGEEPNTRTCPVCLGLPGSLPVINARAIHYGLLMGEAFGCEIAPRSIFDRKNYFYPDQAKNYQISQYDMPLCSGGQLGDVRLNRIHLEEDAAKLVHVGESGRIHGSEASIVDYNRGGTPLAEIVTEPDLHSAEQARDWLNLLRVTLRQLGVCDVNMEEGSLRGDANVSVRRAGETELGTKTELKNMNSFRFLMQGINAEIKRQIALLEGGDRVVAGDAALRPAPGRLSSLRSKEEAHDYRYFPEPDLVPVVPTEEMLAEARAALPELPAARAERYERDWGVPADAARLFAFEPEWGDYFEEAATAAGAVEARPVANWVTELRGRVDGADADRRRLDGARSPGSPRLVAERRTTAGNARKVLDAAGRRGRRPRRRSSSARASARWRTTASWPAIVARVIDANPDVVERDQGRQREGDRRAGRPDHEGDARAAPTAARSTA